jgi:hypothetical protein
MKFTVRLEDDAVGKIGDDTLKGQHAENFIGKKITVSLWDENGNILEKKGRLVEILEESDY